MIDFLTLPITKRSFTVDEYYRMAETGILTPSDRVELIYGEIITMSPIGSQHAACVTRLNAIFFPLFTEKRSVISIQNPVRIDRFSEPEPDVALLQYRKDLYAGKHPSPPHVQLLIEVSDTTLSYDQQVKIPLYAKANVSEVWIVNLSQQQVEVYSQPDQGVYRSIQTYTGKDAIQLTNLDFSVIAQDVLNPDTT